MKKGCAPFIALLSFAVLLLLAVFCRERQPVSEQKPERSGEPEAVTQASLKLGDAPAPPNTPLADLDLRKSTNASAARLQQAEVWKKTHPGVSVDLDPVTGSPKWVGSTSALLTGPRQEGGDADAAVKAFLAENAALFGHGPEVLEQARRVTDYSTARGPSRKVVWHQQLDGIDIFEAVLQANLTAKEELINIGSQMLPTPETAVPAEVRAALTKPGLTVEQAVVAAGENVGEKISADSVRATGPAAAQPDRRQQFRAAMLTDAEAKLVWVPMDEKTLRLAWDVTLTSRSRAEMYRVLVDAENAQVLVRQALTAYISPASYRVYTSESPLPMSPGHETPSSLQPAPASRQLITVDALNTTASPNGWINDGDNITSGNNADAYTDTNADNAADLPRTTGVPNRVFDFAHNLTQEPTNFKDASVTQLFYWTNFMHDRMYELGFTEAAGNFQTDNFSRGGVGNDPVNSEAQDGSGTNNANFSTPVDGGRGRMQMYNWTNPTPDRDGSFEAEVVLHEYAHGVSNRLVGGPSVTISALSTRGMGEGWSDFYGLALTAEASDNPHGNWARGAWSRYLSSNWLSENYYYGARRYSYSTDMLKNPHTLRDIDPNQVDWHTSVPRNPTYSATQDATQVHYQGTVWCVTLWDLRANLIVKHGFATGNERALFLVTEGMKYGPANPNFIQSRDGILQATLVNHPGDLGEVWTAFAKRGMGDGATAPTSSTTTGIVEQYDVPDSLEISDRSGWNITGAKGGPFSPATKTLTLSNDGASSINWNSNVIPWLSVSPASGTLAPGANVVVTVTTQANTVEPGFHSANLVFTNTGTNFNQPIGIRLYVTPPVAQSFDLSTNPGWTMTGQWAYGTPSGSGGTAAGGAGNADPASGATGSSVYGVNLSGNAATTVGGPFYLTSTPVDLSARKTTRLRFKRWLNTNVLSSTRCTVEVSTDGTNWREVFVNAGTGLTDSAWQSMEYDISSIADRQSAVRVRWSYQNVVAGSAFSGWNVDDVEILGEQTAQFTLVAAANAVESAGTLTGTLNLNLPQDGPVTVTLASSDTTAATVPASLTLAAGEVTKNFTITLADDTVLDGTQTMMITASAPSIGSGTHSLAVTDDESATLTLTAPPSTTEGVSGISGSVSVSAPPTRDVIVNLTASLPALTLPASVTIPSGSIGPVNFTFSAPDNAFAEGVKNVTLTAAVAGWVNGTASVAVNDDETPTIVLTGPASAREGDGPQTFTTTVNTIQAVDLTLNLASDDTSELTVPTTVTIPAGQFSATFSAAILNDTDSDGVQTAVITASGGGYTSGMLSVTVADNEVGHYTWSAIASPQKRNKPFTAAVTARDINGVVITNHIGSVTLTSSSPGGVVPFTPTTSGYFENGMSTAQITVTAVATGMTLTATDGNGKTGASNAFDVVPVAHDSFVFSGLPANTIADTFFNATSTAVDDQGSTVTAYSDPTVVDILGSQFDRTLGSTSGPTHAQVFNTAAHDSRIQMIYTAAELGSQPRLYGNLAFWRVVNSGQVMLNFKVRLKHTTLSSFDGRSWETDGWTTVYTSSSFAASGSFAGPFIQPFAYDGVRNLMIDVSFDNSSSSTAGTTRYTASTGNRVLSATSNSTHGDPTTWTPITGPTPQITNELPTLSFYEARSFGPIPASPVNFATGVWSGQAASPAGASAWLRATAPSGVTGFSTIIGIATPTTTVGAETLFTDGFETGTLGTSWSTSGNSGATARTLVTTANTPRAGSYHLTMDTTSTTTGTFAANRPTLTLSLSGRKNVSLEWYSKAFSEDSHTPTLSGPLGTFGSTTNYDGVAVSQDGITWVEVSSLRSLAPSYGTVSRVVLDPVLQRLGWSFNSTFQLRFSQYDDQAIPNDGIGIDDVAVRANPVNAISLSLPATITEGTLNQPVTVTLPAAAGANTTVFLTSNGPARLSTPSSVVIPAGQTSVGTTISALQNQFTDVGKGVIITASASGQTTSYNHIRVVDDEQPVLTLSLPASVTEGGSSVLATVLIDPVQPVATNVFFISGNTAEATVNGSITINAGALSGSFAIAAVNDSRLDGTQSVAITVSGQGMVSDSASIDVLDNEPRTLTVTPPATLTEGGAAGVGTVAISGPRPVVTSITLASSDTTEAAQPASVVIPVGQTSVNFQTFPVDDSIQDGEQNVTVTASAAGFSDGSGSFLVRDNDPASFEWSLIPSPQTRNGSFSVTLTARDSADNTLAGFNGTVSLSARAGAVTLPISSSVSGSFVNGVWSGSLSVQAPGTGVTLLSTGGDGASGTSNAFDVSAGGSAVALAFATVATPHSAGLGIPVQVMAVDAAGLRVNEATGPVTVELITSPGGSVVTSASLTLVDGMAATTFQVPAGLSAVRLQGTAGALTGLGNVFAIQGLGGASEVLFQDGFESGVPGSAWTLTGTGTHRTQVTTANGPRSGNYHLTMDSSVDVSTSRNEATLSLNLAGKANVSLVFWVKEFGDEDHGPPTTPFTGGADFDGIAISQDGTTWHEVQGLRTADGISGSYTRFVVDLSAAAAARGLTLNTAFKIRFNHYDDYAIVTDGFAFDDVAVISNYSEVQEPVVTLFADDFETGVFQPQWQITGTGNHRTLISNQQTPRGSHHLLMDTYVSGLLSRNEATLTLDLTGQQDVTLKFWMKEMGDEDHGPPTIPFTGSADFDGVAVSQDGVTWYLVKGLRGVDGISTNYAEFAVDLSAAAATHGLAFGPGFQIRFNHYDDFPVTSGDGFAFDDITVTGRPVQQLVLNAPATLAEGGGVNATVTLPAVRAQATVITLATNRPGTLSLPVSVTIPAGELVSVPFGITAAQDVFLTGNLITQITASAEGCRSMVKIVQLLDDESAAGFELSLPATLTEGGSINGTVSMTSTNIFDLPVQLSALPVLGLTLPQIVTLPAGATSTTFTLAKPQNDIILEAASTLVSASLGTATDTSTVNLTDDDSAAPLVISLPDSISENATPIGGSVGFAAPLTVGGDLVVSLGSSNPAVLTVPATVTIPAGAGSIAFNATPVDNALQDGTRNISITATAPGVSADTHDISVRDDEVHHLAFDPVASPQVAQAPITITIRAESVDNQTVTNFIGTAALSAANGGGAVGMTPSTTGVFVNGVWTGQITFPASAQNVVVTAGTAGGATGSSNAFNVTSGPRLIVTPSTLNISIPAEEPKVTVPLSLSNPGGIALQWTAEVLTESFVAQPPLADVLSGVNASHAAITALIPNRYDFEEGETGNNISDGGGDMYDGGNYLGTNLTGALPYSDNLIVNSTGLGTGGGYFTRKHPGLFVFAADIAGLTYFEISGGLGADGNGSTDTAILTSTRSGVNYKGFVKRVHGAGDPSVNHLIIVRDDPALTRTASTDTNQDTHRLSGLGAATRVYYLLYSSASGGYINNAQTQSVMDVFLDSISGKNWMQLATTSGSVPAAGSASLDAYVNTTALAQGVHLATLRFTSDDILQPQLDVPVTLTVTQAVHHFDWSAIPSPQSASIPFPVTVTAKDAANATVTAFNGNANLRILGTASLNTTGIGTEPSGLPFLSSDLQGRTQSIYLPAEVGTAGRIQSIALDVTTLPSTLTNFTVRLKHTSKTSFDDSGDAIWESSGWTTVYNNTVTVSATGWLTLPLSTVFDYDGTSHLMVDFSFNNAAYGISGEVRSSQASVVRTLFATTAGGYGAPVDWQGTTPYPYGATEYINLRFSKRALLPLSPASASFTNGVWNGQASVGKASATTNLLALHSTKPSITGESGTFTVTSIGALGLVLPASGVEGGSLSGTVTVTSAPASPLVVSLTSNDTTEATVPATVTIPAGQTSVAFTVTLPDDSLLDGSVQAMLTASAPAYDTASSSVTVQDNESTLVTLTLPATINEGLGASASVQLGTPAAADLIVNLTSSLPADLVLSATVTIPSGQTTATFALTAPENYQIDPERSTTITATLAGSTPATGAVQIIDNESRALNLILFTSSISEGGAVSTTAGYVSLSASVPMPLTINLASSDTSELNVSSTVTIPAGGTISSYFAIAPVNDAIFDGTQTVTLTASASTFTSSAQNISVLDDDVHHFTISTISSLQVRNVPFSVTFTARDINNATISSYVGNPILTAAAGSTALTVSPGSITGFSSGSRTQSVTIGDFAASAALTLTDPATSSTGTSNSFTIGTGGLDHFNISSMPSSVEKDSQVPVTITAQDTGNNTVTLFNQTAALSISNDSAPVTVGTGTSIWSIPLGSQSRTQRMQVIYLPSEVGAARSLSNLALYVSTVPGSPFTGYTIRMKHTAATLASASWDSTGWTTVYQANTTITSTGWHQFNFTTPFAYDGTSSLMIDFSYYNASTGVTQGYMRYTTSATARTTLVQTNTDYGSPLTWSGSTNPSASTNYVLPNVRFGTVTTTVPVMPAITGTFTNGVWSGSFSPLTTGTGVRLRASSGATSGASTLFDVVLAPLQLTLDLPASALESAGTVSGTLSLNRASLSNETVALINSLPGSVSVPSSIMIPVGQTSIPITLTLTDDALKNGARDVIISAEITGVTSSTDTIQILDDELHDFLIAPVASPQVRGAPFVVTLNARSISGQLIPNFTGSVTLSGSAGIGSLFTPKVLNVSAGSATTSVSIASAVTGAQLTATGTTASGTSNLFDVASAGAPTRLVWGSLASLRLENEPLTTSLSLRDAFDNPVTNWSGPVDLAVESVRPQGTATLLLSIPIITQLQSCRSQQILTAAELGGTGRITSLTLRIGQAGAASLLQRLTLRLKHTTASSFPTTGAAWDNVGFTTVYQADTTLEGSGSVTFRFTTPFDYDGTSALMIDYSFLSSSTAGIGGAQFFGRVLSGAPRLLMIGFISQTGIDPLDWDSGNSSVAAYTAQPDVELGFETAVTSITPSQITVTNGVWSGSLALAGSGRSLRLRATTPAFAARSFSNNFELFHPPVLDPEPAYTQGLNNVLTWPAAAEGTGFHYELQRSTKSDFSENVSSQTTSETSWMSSGLVDGQIYYYRMRIRLLGQTTAWSPTVFSIQDASPPLVTAPVAITHGSTGVISGTVWDLSDLYTISIGSTHIAPDGSGRWSHLLTGLAPGTNTFDVTFIDNAEPPNSITVPVTIVRTSGDGHTPPSFHTPPQSTWGIIGREVRIRPIVLGSRPLDFIWKKDGKLLPAATSAELVLPAVKTADAGRYRLEVQAPGSTTPPLASDFDLLLHTALPARLYVKQNGSAKLSTTVSLPKGVPAPTYRWIKPNGSTAANENYGGTNITGAGTNTLSFSNSFHSISGLWRLQITSGSVTTEQSVEVVVQGQVPVITPPVSPMDLWVSQFIDLTLSTTGMPTGFTATGVPTGLTFDKTTGRLSGRLTTASKIDTKTSQPIPSVIKFTATNAWGTSAPVELRLIISDHFGTLEGGWAGLIARDPQTNFNLGGILEMTVAKTGIATGSVTLAGQKHSFVTPLEPADSEVLPGQKSARITFKLPRTKPVKLGDLTVSILLDASNSSATLLDAGFLMPSDLRYYGDGIAGTDGDRLSQPRAMTQDSEGVIYITNAHETGTRIRTLSPLLDEQNRTLDTLPGTLPFSAPAALLLMPDGSLLFTDPASSTLGQRFPDGSSLVWAGSTGSSGHADATTRSAARFHSPTGLCIDPAGNVYVTDTGSHVIRKITPAGIVTTLAGKANTLGHADGAGAKALFNYPGSILYEPLSKTLLVADIENSVIRRVTLTGAVTTYIGSPRILGVAAGIAGNARLSRPTHLVTDGAGNIFFTDDSGIWQATSAGTAAKIGEAVLASSIKGGLLWSAADRQLLLTDPHGHTLLQYQMAVPTLETAPHAAGCPITRTPATQNIPAGLFNLGFVKSSGLGPLGDSHASLNIGSKGIGSFTGRQSDGQTWTASSPLNQARQLFINPLLNKGTASVHGRIIFEPDSPTISDSEQVTWMKLPQPLAPADLTYPEGFDLQLDVLGSRYTPGNLHLFFGLSNSPGSLGFMASEYGLSSLLDQSLTLTAPNALKVSTPNPGALMLTINPATGLITGKFQTGSPARTATINGLMINEGASTRGRGHILLPESTEKGARMNSGTFIIAP